jgi:hypothetical protein
VNTDIERKEAAVNTAAMTPWYRQGWPWFLISLPAIAVVGGIATAVIAIRSDDGQVTADYYRQGLAINAEVARADLARDLGLQATVVLAGFADGDRVRVELKAQRPLPPEAALRLRLTHPGRATEDRSAVLARVAAEPDGRGAAYVGTLQSGTQSPGHAVAWQVLLESPSWRIDDSFTSGQNGRFGLQAR